MRAPSLQTCGPDKESSFQVAAAFERLSLNSPDRLRKLLAFVGPHDRVRQCGARIEGGVLRIGRLRGVSGGSSRRRMYTMRIPETLTRRVLDGLTRQAIALPPPQISASWIKANQRILVRHRASDHPRKRSEQYRQPDTANRERTSFATCRTSGTDDRYRSRSCRPRGDRPRCPCTGRHVDPSSL